MSRSESVTSLERPRPPQQATATHCVAAAPHRVDALSFKLRFAPHRELGRSYVSSLKPRALPSTVTDKLHRRSPRDDDDIVRRALASVRDMFALGPTDRYPEPLLSSHEYGWWVIKRGVNRSVKQASTDRLLNHHIQDSAWMKDRLRILAADFNPKH